MAKKKIERYRDADSGRYVDKDYAQRNPKTTVKETQKENSKKEK